jgi:hypothetical protein
MFGFHRPQEDPIPAGATPIGVVENGTFYLYADHGRAVPSERDLISFKLDRPSDCTPPDEATCPDCRTLRGASIVAGLLQCINPECTSYMDVDREAQCEHMPEGYTAEMCEMCQEVTS